MQIACHTEPRIEEAQVALAQRLALQYAVLQTPALYNVRYSAAMKVSTEDYCPCAFKGSYLVIKKLNTAATKCSC